MDSMVQRTFVGRAERDGANGAPRNPLSLLRSRRESQRPTGIDQSVSFASTSPETRLQQSSAPVAAERADASLEGGHLSALPSAGKIRRQQRFGKGLRRGGPSDRGRPWVVESTTDDRAPVQPCGAVLIERRMLRCGILLLRWAVRKQRGMARWWFIESLQLREDEAAEAASRRDSRSARARGDQRTSPSRNRSQHHAETQRDTQRRSAERLAAEGGWAANSRCVAFTLSHSLPHTKLTSPCGAELVLTELRQRGRKQHALTVQRSIERWELHCVESQR